MSPDKQQIKIAGACGRCVCTTYNQPGDWESAVCDGCGENPYHAGHALPNYLGDLNAMAAAEETCLNTGEQWRQYALNLAKTIAGDHRTRAAGLKLRVDTSILVAAPAHIRAEALLRTLNLWEK